MYKFFSLFKVDKVICCVRLLLMFTRSFLWQMSPGVRSRYSSWITGKWWTRFWTRQAQSHHSSLVQDTALWQQWPPSRWTL